MHRSKQHRYSITSSARCCKNKGTSTPIILAVFRGAYTTVSESWQAADRARSYPQGSLISNAARL
jgi:hypothetical protein